MFHEQIIGDGVSNSKDLPDLEVKAEEDMNVSLGAGYMFANGYMYFNDSKMKLELDTADAEQSRIDRIIIRFNSDPEERTIKARILKGTPASSPKPPEITREGKDGYIHDMSVAQIYVTAGQSYVEDSDITDERADDEVCGYIPLHNIYRGLDINEHGMITMPNQNYVEMDIEGEYSLDGDFQYDADLYLNFYHTKFKIDAQIDRQDEVKDGKFVAKADGTYMFSVHTKLLNTSDRYDKRKLEAQISINDGVIDALLYLFNNYLTESQYMGSNMVFLKKGDVAELTFGRRYEEKLDLLWVRLNIAKLN